ncbi:MAG: bifunctional phosphopantothenoylcysteine decarboxylase/phosphopantothenate--cysteine ligase CoaBC [Bacteroidales bacterium]|nr:bifunctional phosphopantothenoylcysteine decarboxylase/phosphopantothenate--cysteine ligase CoaBC [Bacteroidales bacterium]
MGKGNILVGITGGIAAYKTLSLIRLLVKAGYEVKVVATPHALEFVTPLTIETLSNHPLYSDLFTKAEEKHTQHISLHEWADAAVIAPATANCIGKLAAGIADDLLSTTLLAFRKPLFMAPSMNENMYLHFSTQKNMAFLQGHGVHLIEPEEGFLACQTQGKGRMAEPERIFATVDRFLYPESDGKGLTALVTAGPTYEALDSVRFIGNRSSGKMGFCIAEELAKRGVDVQLVSGPTHLKPKHPRIRLTAVESADEMYRACAGCVEAADIAVMTAAVADYRPAHPAGHKIKKSDQPLHIELEPTTDILKTLGMRKRQNQFFVGFALETDNEEENARHKLESKNADMIVLNSLRDKGAGFQTDTNKVTLFFRQRPPMALPLLSKEETAEHIVNEIMKNLKEKS